ncbi:Peptidyl-prolyl cis-trans isomerase cyp18 [Rubripirellula lacrimiformis]|uniref:Peptidyl-prolyl cis-trans isomerase n=1 Tax=Rubripirellula lacrimiformis TaxID=1930273 RepID=A0A517N8H9_9BACT|nr:peptidylprolyl isomerase [Rubripirellula lacrimiformis]QDT03444.1 Peptidyl-prolyl cis-trans isomerase cyp18 [Rubripirellula lacrimiformis]
MQKRISMFAAAFALMTGVFASTVLAADKAIVVEMETTEGKIVLELDQAKAPKTVANFLAYIEKDHYPGTVFHRVMPDFMIQGGGMDATLSEKETLPPIRNEASNGLRNDEYTIAMARTGDPHSATSQFFINSGTKNSFLNRADPRSDGFGYAVFGKVIEGKDVVDKIEAKPTRTVPAPKGGLMENVPVEPVLIQAVRVVSGVQK